MGKFKSESFDLFEKRSLLAFGVVFFLSLSCTSFSKSPEKKQADNSSVPSENSNGGNEEKPFRLSSNVAKDGSLILLFIQDVKESPLQNLKVQFEGESYPVMEGSEPQRKFALIPVAFNSKPRSTKVLISYNEKDKETKVELPLTVEDGNYPSEVLKVGAKHIDPPKSVVKRILAEQKEVGALYRIEKKERYWKGQFSKPIDSEITSPYGNKRVYNGKMKSFHQGMDFRAKVGTPILSPEGGVVVLAKDLYFTGGTVILDHGFGFFTVYCHMSEVKTKVGVAVKKGEVLGLSGATGRVSGPHLHWGAVVNRQKVNPENLLRVLPVAL
jgi:murein DD-endopeptidase MepM/ murein hydrolase activator NlpD